MSKSCFTERAHPPTMEEVYAALGPRRKAWDELSQYMADYYQARGELIFGGLNYGWALRFRKGGKPLLALFPGEKGFIANVVVGRSLLKKAHVLELGENARRVLESAKRFHEGCWLYIKVRTKQDLRDIQQLIALKFPPRPVGKGSLSAARAA